jgi:hypothetical protein
VLLGEKFKIRMVEVSRPFLETSLPKAFPKLFKALFRPSVTASFLAFSTDKAFERIPVKGGGK